MLHHPVETRRTVGAGRIWLVDNMARHQRSDIDEATRRLGMLSAFEFALR